MFNLIFYFILLLGVGLAIYYSRNPTNINYFDIYNKISRLWDIDVEIDGKYFINKHQAIALDRLKNKTKTHITLQNIIEDEYSHKFGWLGLLWKFKYKTTMFGITNRVEKPRHFIAQWVLWNMGYACRGFDVSFNPDDSNIIDELKNAKVPANFRAIYDGDITLDDCKLLDKYMAWSNGIERKKYQPFLNIGKHGDSSHPFWIIRDIEELKKGFGSKQFDKIVYDFYYPLLYTKNKMPNIQFQKEETKKQFVIEYPQFHDLDISEYDFRNACNVMKEYSYTRIPKRYIANINAYINQRFNITLPEEKLLQIARLANAWKWVELKGGNIVDFYGRYEKINNEYGGLDNIIKKCMSSFENTFKNS